MGHSESRIRTRFRGIRLSEQEDDLLQVHADRLGTTVPALIRSVMFNRPVEQRPTCGNHHGNNCSVAHHETVLGYRLARYNEEMQLENDTGLGRGELEHWKANGGKLITFGDWLKAHKGKGEHG